MPIDPATHVGAVRLRVNDLAQAKSFYERVIGLRELEGDGETVRLGPEGGPSLVELIGDPDAPRRPAGSTGLFHLALLVPSRVELARALRRVMNGGWQFTGASDHLVSEALYLRDPEYNGIEIYRDRPREEWSIVDGQIQMATLPLDLQGIAGLADDADDGMPAGTDHGPRPPAGGRARARRQLLPPPARHGRDRPQLPRSPLHVGRRLPPPHRREHLGEPRRPSTPARLSRLGLIRAGAAEPRKRSTPSPRQPRPPAPLQSRRTAPWRWRSPRAPGSC